MTLSHRCPDCGATLPVADVPCPRCLLATGLEHDDSTVDPAAVGAESPTFPEAGGRVLGDYRLIEVLARGGMGVVYRALQRGLNRVVAVKVPVPAAQLNEDSRRRFCQEAEVAAGLKHPNIVPIYEIGEHEGQPFFAMELVEGESLAARVRERPLPPEQAVRIVREVAEAVHFAHGQGILHRDLKPSNILIGQDERPRITDFGLARRLDSDSSLTLSGQALGSPNYMPPEQASGHWDNVGPASDVYSLGAVLYHLLSGRPPFLAASPALTLAQVIGLEAVGLRQLNSSLPKDLETLCAKCLEKEPERRYSSALELVRELARWERGEPILARPVSSGERFMKWCRRNPRSAMLILTTASAIMVGSLTTAWQWGVARASLSRVEALSVDLRLGAVEAALRENRDDEALASLASLVRRQPDHSAAVQRLLSLLQQQEFGLPRAKPLVHSSSVSRVHFSPSGRLVAVVTADFSISVWNVAEAERAGVLPWYSGTIAALWFDREERHVFALGERGEITKWELSGMQPQVVLAATHGFRTAHTDSSGRCVAISDSENNIHFYATQPVAEYATVSRVTGLRDFALSPNADRLVTWGREVAVWDVRNKRRLSVLDADAGAVCGAAFSPDGKQVVTGSNGRSREGASTILLQLWEAETGRRLGEGSQESAVEPRLRFGAQGRWLLSGGVEEALRIWDCASGLAGPKPLRHAREVLSSAFSPCGQLVATGSKDATAQIWHVDTGEPWGAPLRQRHSVTAVDFSPGNDCLAVGDVTGAVRLWDVRSRKSRVWQFSGLGPGGLADLHPSLPLIAGSDTSSGVEVRDYQSGAVVFRKSIGNAAVTSVTFNADGRMLYLATTEGSVNVLDAESGNPLGSPLRHESPILRLIPAPVGDRVATVTAKDRAVHLWDSAGSSSAGRVLRSLKGIEANPEAVAFSPDGKGIFIGTQQGQFVAWDGADGGTVRRLFSVVRQGHQSPPPVGACAVRSDGRYGAAGWHSGLVRIVDLHTGAAGGPKSGHAGEIIAMAFSPDGAVVATGSLDRTVRLWEVPGGRAMGSPIRTWGPAAHLLFSGDGRRLFTCSRLGAIQMWESRTGLPVAEAALLPGIERIRLGADGGPILASGATGGVRLWDLPDYTEPAPAWLPDLAEAIAGLRLNNQGLWEPTPEPVRERILTRLRSVPESSPYGSWARWFVAEGPTRTISPGLSLASSAYVNGCLASGTPEGLREAALLAPNDPGVRQRLGLRAGAGTPDPPAKPHL